MVGPTKVKPAAFSSLEIARDSSVSGRSRRGSARSSGAAGRRRTPEEVRKPSAPGSRGGPRARDGGHDLGAVAHDAGVGHQRLDMRGVEAGDRRRLEAREGAAEGVALAQDGDPGQAGLEAVEDQLLEQGAVVDSGTPHSVS